MEHRCDADLCAWLETAVSRNKRSTKWREKRANGLHSDSMLSACRHDGSETDMRPRVYQHHAHTRFNMCARGAGTNGDVLNVHTETFFIGKTSDFLTFLEHL